MNAEAWNEKGGTLMLTGRYDEAIACYDRALEIDANDRGARIGRTRAQDLFDALNEQEAGPRKTSEDER